MSARPPEPDELARVERRLERERRARAQAEAIAEETTSALYDRQRELELLEAVAAAANLARSFEDALQVAIDRLCVHVGWPLGHAYLCSGDRLVSAKIWHAESGGYAAFRRASEARTFELGEGLPGRVAARGEAIWIEDLHSDANFPRRNDVAMPERMASGFAFPVLVSSETVAVIEIFSHLPESLDERLLALAGQIGMQLGRVVERSRSRDLVAHHAMHDALTDLPNRVLLLDRLGLALGRSQRQTSLTAVLFVDLDRFKSVNESHGHSYGDAVLREVARRLGESVAEGDTVARLGSDEFVVLCESLPSERDALLIADRLQLAILPPIDVGAEEEQFVSASIGIALVEGEEVEPETIIHHADVAMHRAKDLGGARHELFDEGMRERVRSRLRIERALRRAITGGELRLHYQPVIALADRGIVGVEALVRWEDPERGMVAPGEFIPIAEEIGLIDSIGEWVLQEACRQARRWRRELGARAPLPINVNVAARQLAQESFVDAVAGAIDAAGIKPGDIALEITESALIENAEVTSQVLAGLRAFGINVLLDDFGTGYSSLGYLHRFPIDELKIDRSFIAGFGERPESSTLVGAIVGMGQALGIATVAEGIETEGQALEAARLGCDLAQGFLFARPAPPEQIARLVRDRMADAAGAPIVRQPR